MEPVTAESVEERGGRLVIPASDTPMTCEEVRVLRHADQRQEARRSRRDRRALDTYRVLGVDVEVLLR